MSSRCTVCGAPLTWGGMAGWVPHTDNYHRARRALLLKIIGQRLHEERHFRWNAFEAALYDGTVVVWWRVVLPDDVGFFRTEVPGDLWDTMDHDWLLTTLGSSLRDSVEIERGIRPHHMQVRYRVFDERASL